MGIAKHQDIKIDETEINEAVFMPLKEYAQVESFDTGTIIMKKILNEMSLSVTNVEDLKEFLGFSNFDIEFSKDVYNQPTRGKYFFAKKHIDMLKE
jgi:hypothetical protein